MLEYFYFEEKRKRYMGIVFETLGKSLFDFVKDNNYRGIKNLINFRFFLKNNSICYMANSQRDFLFT